MEHGFTMHLNVTKGDENKRVSVLLVLTYYVCIFKLPMVYLFDRHVTDFSNWKHGGVMLYSHWAVE